MVQPSPHLLLRPAASVASSLRLLTHPKVPLTPGESRQLLNVITKSFRNQLAIEHGATTPSNARSSQPTPNAPSSLNNAIPTERHLSDILSNPLFKPLNSSAAPGRRDPMDVFDEACAKGLMTPSRARACLKAKRQQLRTVSSEDYPKAVGNRDAGAKVLKWLLATGAKENSAWLLPFEQHVPRFPDIIFAFVVLENRGKSLWDLFEHYVANKIKGVDVLLYHHSMTLAQVVSLESAYESLAKAESILLKHGFSYAVRQRCLDKAVQGLARATLKYAQTAELEKQAVPAELFEQFLQRVHRSTLGPVYGHRLEQHHPAGAITAPALQYLQSLGSDYQPSDDVTWLALNLAQNLLKGGKQADAHWVMSFLEKQYSESLGIETQATSKKYKQSKEEDSNLELLNNLELGIS